MGSRNNGGPAFPVVAENGLGHISGGMSLRDYFAGQVLTNINIHVPTEGLSSDFIANWIEECTELAYQIADEMLKARDIQ